MHTPCSVTGCEKTACRNGLCWAHRKRRARGSPPLHEPVREYAVPLLAQLKGVAIRYAEADSDDDAQFERLGDRLRRLALAYARRHERANLRPPAPNRPGT